MEDKACWMIRPVGGEDLSSPYKEVVSRPVLEALLSQKKEGRLNSPSLEKWVEKFEVR